MLATIIIVLLIVLYSSWVIYKKVKDARKGKFCGCGCDSCPSEKKCDSNKTKE